MENNFDEFLSGKFQPANLSQWIDQINKDLKTGDYQSLAHLHTDGLKIEPAYTSEGLKVHEQDFRPDKYWGVMEEILVQDEKQANSDALKALDRGASGLLFYLSGSENPAALFRDIEIQYLRIRLVIESDPSLFLAAMQGIIAERHLKPADLDVFINRDPLENLARTGNWFHSEEEDFALLHSLNEFGYPQRSLNLNLFGNAGATAAQQLGIAIAMAYETHLRMGSADLDRYWVNFAVGQEYFTEIAKLRAFRRLWRQLASELNVSWTNPIIYAETSQRSKSIKDVYNNMIRSTTEAMAAVIGGADEVLVHSFDTTLGEASEFGKRVARNQQHILQFEGHLSEVQDIAAGSNFLERITDQLANSGWDFFKQIEASGGYIAAMRNGWLQEQISLAGKAAENNLRKGGILVGVNKFDRQDPDLANMIKQPQFSREQSGNYVAKPLQVRRLAETFETEFRNS